MPECITCKSFTKFNGGLCYECYKKDKTDKDLDLIEDEIATGLSDKEHKYRYGMIKGRIAETLIQELFLSLEYSVFRYGMENTIPGVMELLRGVKSNVAKDIRQMPDFVVQNRTNGEVFFIEVKFRASGEYKLKDLGKDYPYRNAFIILVSKRHIKCITIPELEAGEEITATSRNYLGNRKEFELDNEVIKEFCNFAVKFFENV